MALLQISEPGESPAPHQRRLAVGIDLGTTNSLVAAVRSSVPEVLPDDQGRPLLPSVVRYLPAAPSTIMDMGSGAGLPGVILAILTDHQIHLVESDSRKVSFMRTALRETGTQATLHEQRMESLPSIQPDIITARALAPLAQLLDLSKHQHHEQLHYLFLKGREVKQELTALPSYPKLEAEAFPSLTDSDASIVRLKPSLSN